jgi:glutathione S-transferase
MKFNSFIAKSTSIVASHHQSKSQYHSLSQTKSRSFQQCSKTLFILTNTKLNQNINCFSSIRRSIQQQFKHQQCRPIFSWFRGSNSSSDSKSTSDSNKSSTHKKPQAHAEPHTSRITSSTRLQRDIPRLTYLNIRVRGEVTRLILAEVGQQFIDERVTRNQLATTRQMLPFRTLPIFSEIVDDASDSDESERNHDEKPTAANTSQSSSVESVIKQSGVQRTLGQSGAINRLLARRYNLMGDNEWHAALIDSIYEEVSDLIDSYVPVVLRPLPALANTPTSQGNNTPVAASSSEASANLAKLNSNIDNAWTAFAHYLAKNQSQSGFIVGNRLSIADIAVFHITSELHHLNKTLLAQRLVFPQQHAAALEKHRQLIASRDNIKQYMSTRPQTPI